jgi:hypothetical protein
MASPQRLHNVLGSQQPIPPETTSNFHQPGFIRPTPQTLHQTLSALNQNVQGLHNAVGQNGEVQQHHTPGFQIQQGQPFTQQQITRQSQTTHTSQTSITYSSQTQDRNAQGGNIRSEIRMSFAQTSSSTPPSTMNPQRTIHDPIMEVPHRVRLNPYGFQPGDILEDPVTENTPRRNQFRHDIRSIQLRLTFMEQQALAVGRRFPLMALAPMAHQLLTELELACQKSNVSHDDPFATDVRRRINLLLNSNGGQTDQTSRAANFLHPVTSVPPSSTPNSAAPATSTRSTSASTVNPSAISATVNMANINSSAYLLSSPNGPQAILFSPRGTFSTANPSRGAHRTHAQRNNTRARAHEARHRLPGQHARALQARHNQREGNLTAIARSVWLLLRLFFLVWFFGIGGTWTRFVIVLIGCSIVFLAHAGVFAPLREWWNPVREHLEALIPLAADNAQNNARPAPAQGDGPQVQRPGEPDPQETATRLLRERRAQDGNWVQGNLRRVEQAIALFMATLVPGIGERHIRARNAAEVLRLAEQRLAEEERERQVRRSNGEGTGEEGSGDAPSNGVTGEIENSEDSNAPVTDANEQPAVPVEVHG